MTVDDQLVVIGTCNWDIRSLILHEEVVAIFYDRGVATNYGDQYERDIQDCVEITEADLAKADPQGEVPQLVLPAVLAAALGRSG